MAKNETVKKTTKSTSLQKQPLVAIQNLYVFFCAEQGKKSGQRQCVLKTHS